MCSGAPRCSCNWQQTWRTRRSSGCAVVAKGHCSTLLLTLVSLQLLAAFCYRKRQMPSAAITVGLSLYPEARRSVSPCTGLGLHPLHQENGPEPRGFVSGEFLAAGISGALGLVWGLDAPSCLQLGMAAGTRCFQSLMDYYFFWCYSASAVVFTNLVEPALLHEISQLTDVEKQRLQLSATVTSFSGLLTLSIVALEEEGVHV